MVKTMNHDEDCYFPENTAEIAKRQREYLQAYFRNAEIERSPEERRLVYIILKKEIERIANEVTKTNQEYERIQNDIRIEIERTYDDAE